MVAARLLHALPAAILALLVAAAPAAADTKAGASYVVNLGGNIIATANFTLTDGGGAYDLTLNANVTGLASLVAAGVLKAHSTGTVGADASSAALSLHASSARQSRAYRMPRSVALRYSSAFCLRLACASR